MKKTLLLLTLTALMTTGCSKTWSGIKQDTHEVYENTKETIHEVTAPDEKIITDPAPSNTQYSTAVSTSSEPVEVITPVAN